MTYRGFHKHIFSGVHRDEIEILLHKRKGQVLQYIDSNDHSVLPFVIPNSRLPTMALKLCYGCNCAYYCKGYTKKHTCTKLKENLETLRTILAKPIVVESTVSEPVVLPEEVVKMKKRIVSLESNLKSAEKMVDESEDISQAFIELLQRLQENHKDIFMEQMVQLKYSRSEVFTKMCQELDIEEGEINTPPTPPHMNETEW